MLFRSFDRRLPAIPPVVWAEILGAGSSHQALQNPLSVFHFDSGKSSGRPWTAAVVLGGFGLIWAVSDDCACCRWWGVVVGRSPGGWGATDDSGGAPAAHNPM